MGTTVAAEMILSTPGGPPPRAWGQRAIACVCFADRPDHPHERGDNASNRSPQHWLSRTTPTSVGTTLNRELSSQLLRGPPPRAWGQRDLARCARSSYPGPPPRAWGQPMVQPANTRRETDHPHERGDNSSNACLESISLPDHPHERGDNFCSTFQRSCLSRTTPTSVGTTLAGNKLFRLKTDHPHERGDNQLFFPRLVSIVGPPPRAWGQRSAVLVCLVALADHPHERGDNTIFDR